jgi:hypothetical protein
LHAKFNGNFPIVVELIIKRGNEKGWKEKEKEGRKEGKEKGRRRRNIK